MALRAALVASSIAAALAAPTCSTLSLDATTPVHTTAPYFASFNIDSSEDREFFMLDWSAPQLTAAAVGLSGGEAHIRFGGTGNNWLTYDVPGTPPCTRSSSPHRECLNETTWAGVSAFAASAHAPIVFGVNMFPAGNEKANHSFDPTNAIAFFKYSKARGDNIWGIELGNELGPDGVLAAAEQAAGLLLLDDALSAIYGAGSPRPVLIGPDALGFHTPAPPLAYVPSADVLAYMSDFIVAMRGRLHAVTHHEYIEVNLTNILDPTFLDLTGQIADQVVAAVRKVSPTVEVWAGEIGPHNGEGGPGDGRPGNCGDNKICGRWGSTIWYADAMSAKARAGYAAFCRQDIIGADYGILNFTTLAPSPDYWLLLLWQRLVGTRVLAVTTPPAGGLVRVSAFCGIAPDTATLILINLSPSPTCVTPPADADASAPRREYALSPAGGGGGTGLTSAHASLNGGAPLALSGTGVLPPLPPKVVAAGAAIEVPALSVVFVNYDTTGAACA